jgi:hypothetical protein
MIQQDDQESFTLHVTFRSSGSVEAIELAAIYTEALGILRPEVKLMSTSLSMSATWKDHRPIFCGHMGPDGEECAQVFQHPGPHRAAGIGAPSWACEDRP